MVHDTRYFRSLYFKHTSLSKYSYTRTSISNWSTCDYDRYSNEVTPRWWWQLRNLKSRFRSFVIVRLPSTDSLCRYPPKLRIKMALSRISSIPLTSKGLDHNLYRGTSDLISCIPFSCGCNFIQCLLHHLSCHWNNASTRGSNKNRARDTTRSLISRSEYIICSELWNRWC